MKEVKQKEVLSEYVQASHDPQYVTPVLDKASIEKRGQLWEVLFQEEVVGSFGSEEEVLNLANSTKYGLCSMVWTSDLKRANRMSLKLDSGIVWINCWLVRDLRTPFGGVKDSGVGREGGTYALNFFTETTNVCISYD